MLHYAGASHKQKYLQLMPKLPVSNALKMQMKTDQLAFLEAWASRGKTMTTKISVTPQKQVLMSHGNGVDADQIHW